jgi:molybdopterin synthase sulfur carrier subunit
MYASVPRKLAGSIWVHLYEKAMVNHRGLVAWSTILHVSEKFPRDENDVTVHYWASARSAAGIAEERVPAGTLAEVLQEISLRHRDRDRFDDVLGTCSILIGETPVGSRVPADVRVAAGDTVEFLPPFAGG